MASDLNVRIRTPKTSAEMKNRYNPGLNTDPRVEANQLIDLLGGLAGGSKIGTLVVDVNGQSGVQASATLTLATSVTGDTATVAGVTFTEVASGALGTAASGTFTLSSSVAGDTAKIGLNTYTELPPGTVLQSVQTVPQGTTPLYYAFDQGTTDTLTAVNLVAAINATTNYNGFYATSSGAVVTVTDVTLGTVGNSVVIVGSTHITASGATLSGGTNANPLHFNHGATDTITAANLAAVIGTNATIGTSFSVGSAAAVVTVLSYEPGVAGNYVPISATGAITASGALLSGGVTPTRIVYHLGM
jgi:hypothetical protein